MIGRCRLCLEEKELQFSHLLPRALYRLVGSASDQAHPDTVQITINGRKKSSEQARRHILCARCEERFNSKGERWVLRNCYRGKGRFRLRTEVRSRKPLESELGIEAYPASEEEVECLVYFCLSVVWRASLCDWPHRGQTYESIDLGPYQEEIRRFLNDEGEIPKGVALTIILSQLGKPVLAFSFPVSYRVEACRCHRFHIPGISFVVEVGKLVSFPLRGLCILRSQFKPIFIGTVGDERVQDEVLRLMGKIAPAWAEYPLTEGVEKFKP
jgi:hypothetical protein